MDNNVYLFKLASGEEIISKIMIEGGLTDIYLLDNPCTLVLNNANGISLAPTMFGADTSRPIVLNKAAIASYTSDIREEILNGYLSAVSKIVIPNKNILFS